MRFLVVFIDMLRPDLCRTFEPSAPSGPMDGFFQRLGGTYFRRAFVPSPMTTRGVASFWTGLYPGKTGCHRAKHWPRDFMPADLPNLFSVFDRAGYSLHCFLNRNEKAFGLMPADWQERVHLNDSYDLQAFLQTVPQNDNQVIFVSLIDVHWFMTDHGYTVENFMASQQIPARALERANEVHPFDGFDATMIFSDHGFYEGSWKDCPWQEKLSRGRTGIALAWRIKGDRIVRVDDRLRGIQDAMPTLIEVAGIEPIATDGRSLLATWGHDFIVHEDIMNLGSVGPESEVDLWGITVPDGYVAVKSTDLHMASENESATLERMGTAPYIASLMDRMAPSSPSMAALRSDYLAEKRRSDLIEQFRIDGGYPDPIFADGTPVDRWRSILETWARPNSSSSDLAAKGLAVHQQGRVPEAMTAYRQSIISDPANADAHYLLGILVYGTAGAASAAPRFSRATTLSRDHAAFQAGLAKVLLETKALPVARRSLRRSLALAPEQVELRASLAGVQSILYARGHGRADPGYLGDTYDELGPRLKPNPYAERLREHFGPLLSVFPAGQNLRLLDIGCGTGPVGRQFRDLSRHIVGCDMSEKSLRIAARHGGYERLVRADILMFLGGEADESYDAVIAAGSICYFGELHDLMGQCRRLLRLPGYLAFTTFRSEQAMPERDLGNEVFGVFKHSDAYIRRVAKESGFDLVVAAKDLKIFDEGKRDIVDDLYVLRKQSST